MTEQELRVLVRQAVAFHLKAPQPHVAAAAPVTIQRQHQSHALFMLPAEPGDACVIEPAVTCTHCGFCKSYGH